VLDEVDGPVARAVVETATETFASCPVTLVLDEVDDAVC
jgi:hypothetical protein